MHPTETSPPLRSFGRRRGRKLRAHRAGLMTDLLPRLEVRAGAELPQLAHFPDPALLENLNLEIGFGSGEHLAGQALADPRAGFIGCEPYVDGVANLLKQVEEHPALERNLRVYMDDARELIDALPDACLARAFILFPDPWPKARHHKRRLVQPPFLAALARVMKPGAELRLASDHADYVAWMLEALAQSPDFTWTARESADWLTPPSDWIRTKYQEWSETEGRHATYLRFRRR